MSAAGRDIPGCLWIPASSLYQKHYLPSGTIPRDFPKMCLMGHTQIKNGVSRCPDFFIHDRSFARIDQRPRMLHASFGLYSSPRTAVHSEVPLTRIPSSAPLVVFSCFADIWEKPPKIFHLSASLPLMENSRPLYSLPVFRLERFYIAVFVDADQIVLLDVIVGQGVK